MANQPVGNAIGREASVLATNKVLRNTYMLLALTLAFSAVVATVSMSMGVPYLGFFPTIIGFFALLFLVHKTANSAFGLVSIFLFTGFLGLTLGPLLNAYMTIAPSAIPQALGLTAFTFIGLSAYVLTTKADMSFLRGFVVIGVLVLLGIIGIYAIMQFTGGTVPPGIQLAISAFVVLLMSAIILYQTSDIVHGGETNYILATTTLFVSLYNLFTSLLHLIGFMGDD
ncbi:MAG: Bax inhibitor-1/YccA family protein [Pseudomonadota bacterium]